MLFVFASFYIYSFYDLGRPSIIVADLSYG